MFDATINDFVTTDIVKQYGEEKFNDRIAKLKKDDQFYNLKYQTFKDEL